MSNKCFLCKSVPKAIGFITNPPKTALKPPQNSLKCQSHKVPIKVGYENMISWDFSKLCFIATIEGRLSVIGLLYGIYIWGFPGPDEPFSSSRLKELFLHIYRGKCRRKINWKLDTFYDTFYPFWHIIFSDYSRRVWL